MLVVSLKNIPKGKELLADFGELRQPKFLSTTENGTQGEEKVGTTQEEEESQKEGKEEEANTGGQEQPKGTEGEELVATDNH